MTTLREAAIAAIARWDLPHRHHQLSTTRIFEDLRTALEAPEQEPAPGIKALQAEGKGPAPCARFCEAQAFKIEIRNAAGEGQVLQAKCDAFFANTLLALEEIDDLTKERDALKADALRYRWITKQIVEDTMEQLEKAFSVFDDHAETVTQYEFDAAIDASIGATA